MLEMHDGVLEQFEDREQQHEAYQMGMWLFLASEIMIFGALFLSYTVYRLAAPRAFDAASAHMNIFLGSLNTAVLLGSSLTMALAIRSLQVGTRRATVIFLGVTLLLGLAFLGIKFTEYAQHISDHLLPGAAFATALPDPSRVEMYFYLYFLMTGVHALHMTVGILATGLMMVLVWTGVVSPQNYKPLELTGLYWHFVDVVWIFLFPVFYLPGLHQ